MRERAWVCDGSRSDRIQLTLLDRTRTSVIHMSRGYVDAMRMHLGSDPTFTEFGRFINDTQYLASITLKNMIRINEGSAIARSTVLFVDTLIHELTHAVSGAYFDIVPMAISGMPLHSHVYKPFLLVIVATRLDTPSRPTYFEEIQRVYISGTSLRTTRLSGYNSTLVH